MKNLFLLAALAAGSLPAQVNYQYTGKPFTLFSCVGNTLCGTPGPNTNTSYTATDIVTGTLTLDQALPSNLNLQDVSGYSGFKISLNDGHQTMTATAGYTGGFRASVSTDAAGNITEWDFVVNCCFYPNNGVATAYAPDWPSGSQIFDQAVLTAPSPNNGYPNTPLNMAFNFNSPGTWGAGSQGGAPYGTLTRVSQMDQFDNFDLIEGDIGKPQTTTGFFSSYGGTEAAGGEYTPIKLDGVTVTNDAPTAGAWSSVNQGYGAARILVFRTFTNNYPGTMTFKVNAVLDGRFKPDPFRLPYGPVRAGGAVHVFDTDKFIAALHASGKSAAIFLLGGYPVQSFFVANALDPGSVFQNLLDLFPGALLGDASVIPTGPIDGTQLSFPLTTDFIVVGQGKRFTVMFDVATSAQAQTGGGQTGGGSADFFNTLQPGPIFFTDANGNRATGITAVGASPAPPLSATGLSLTPVTATHTVGTTHTLTATATTTGGAPLPNAVVQFAVTDGPNKGVAGGGATDANGQAIFSYTGKSGAGTDTIQANIGALNSNAVQATWQVPSKCPQSQGYWKNHPNVWPVSSLILGSQTYSKAELLQTLGNPGGGDASQILAVQLIAAKLNIAHGSDPAPISVTIAAADQLLAGFSGKLPYKVKTPSTTGQSMTQSGATLGSYNTGQLTLSCTP